MPHVRDELLAVLRCPVTKASLVQEGDELVSTVPGPAGSPLRYRITDDIPLLVRPEQLSETAADAPDAEAISTTDAAAISTTTGPK